MTRKTKEVTPRVVQADHSDLDINFWAEPETEPIEGNASAIDPETDAEIATAIRDQLSAGNDWAWCTVVMEARLEGLPFIGRSVLGACSYESESAFREDPTWTDMRNDAIADLNAQIAEAFKRIVNR